MELLNFQTEKTKFSISFSTFKMAKVQIFCDILCLACKKFWKQYVNCTSNFVV